MTGQIISRDTIKAQARRAAEADWNAGRHRPDIPYTAGTPFAKKFYAAYLHRQAELMEAAQIRREAA